ncbi:MAG TPA: amidohydrolase family protein [Thermomicrobiales bacterium]|nr:amidohydrolase family protein [Thermomicrobiales bacterium]
MNESGIVDAHHHIWRRQDLAWLNGPMVPRIFGPYEPIRRDYLIGEYIADVTPFGVERSVYVQTNWPLARAVDEARWAQETADASGWPHAIIGSADLLDDGCGAVFAEQARVSPLMRGTRLQLHWHENPAYRYAPVPDQMNDRMFRRNLGRLVDLGWLFELQVFAGQMADAARLAADFPDIAFVLVHAGMLERDAADARRRWRDGMARLAEQPNVVVKLSGQGTFSHRVEPAFIADVVHECLALFGSGRCMFGSNFPVEKIWTDFGPLLRAYQDALANEPPVVRADFFRETARRVYRL